MAQFVPSIMRQRDNRGAGSRSAGFFRILSAYLPADRLIGGRSDAGTSARFLTAARSARSGDRFRCCRCWTSRASGPSRACRPASRGDRFRRDCVVNRRHAGVRLVSMADDWSRPVRNLSTLCRRIAWVVGIVDVSAALLALRSCSRIAGPGPGSRGCSPHAAARQRLPASASRSSTPWPWSSCCRSASTIPSSVAKRPAPGSR